MAKMINPVNHEKKLCFKVRFYDGIASYQTPSGVCFFFLRNIALSVIVTQIIPLSQVLNFPFIFPPTEVASNNPFIK